MIAASPDVTVDDVRAAIRSAQPPTAVVPPPPVPQVQLARTLPRYGTLRNFVGEGSAERAYRFGQWFLAVRGIDKATAFCRENGIVLSRAQQEGVNEAGGFLVPEEFGNDLIDLREQYGVFRREAKMVPMASDTRSDPRRTGGLTAYFVAESGAGTASDKSWDRVSLTAKKLMVLARYSSEVNEDAVINMGDDLAGEIAYAFAVKEDNCGFIGDGSSTYGGMQGVCTKIKGLSGTIANIAGLVVATGTGYASSYGSAVDRFRSRCRKASGVRRHAAGEMVHAQIVLLERCSEAGPRGRRRHRSRDRRVSHETVARLRRRVRSGDAEEPGGQPGMRTARRSQPRGQLR
jgi:hypothetical protein